VVRRPSGLGLGLTIARPIVASNAPKWTRFSVRGPAISTINPGADPLSRGDGEVGQRFSNLAKVDRLQQHLRQVDHVTMPARSIVCETCSWKGAERRIRTGI
jgi:hypothetical protein